MVPSAAMLRLHILSAVALVAVAGATGVSAQDRQQSGAVVACIFNASDQLCEAQDWNDDNVVSAADPLGLLSFTPPAPGEIRVVDAGPAVIVRSAAAKVRVDKATAGLVLDSAAGVRLTDSVRPPALTVGNVTQPLTQVRAVQLLARGVEFTCDAGSESAVWTIEFLTARSIATRLRPAHPASVSRAITTVRAAPGERFYGLTERIVDSRTAGEVIPKAIGALDRRGEVVTMAVTPTIALYTPFCLSSRGYGAYVEGTMTGTYDIAKTAADTVAVDFEFNQRTGQHGVVYFVGDYDTVLDEYTALTGRPFVPPRWAFHHLRWRDEHRIAAPAQLDGVDMNADVVNDVTMYEALGIPAGNYEFDRPWTSGTTDRGERGFASFGFDPVRFPNSDKMLAGLQRRGYHVLAWGGPWALGDNAVDAEQFGYYAPRSRILIDYTNADAIAWWTGKVQSLIDLGVSGMKLDRSEFALSEIGIGDVVPDRATDIFADGRNGRELVNGYTIEYARVHYNAFADRLGGDFFHYLRTGYAGSQQYGIFWGGDITGRANFGLSSATDLGLRSAILSLARVAFMAFPIWGTDTGGYYQFGQRDVFARWLEFSALCPLMEIGGGNQGGGQHAPWDMPTEPHVDTEMIDIYRKYVTLHHELVPLLYSLALDAHTSGRPVARPLVFDFPDDPAVGDLWDEFLLGHDLLVAPLWQDGARSRPVYLPQGTWIDYWQPSQRVTGPATINADAPLDRLPLYVRAGGILPLEVTSSVTGNGSAASAGRLTIDAYPSGTGALTLHEDAGDSLFTLEEAPCSGSPCVRLRIAPGRGGYIVRLLSDQPRQVMLDGGALDEVRSFAAFEASERSWYYDAGAGRVWVKFATNGAGAQVEAVR
jgi:alpha-D-xyloside xylohydrolase